MAALRQFSECCRQVYAGMAGGELHEHSWSCIAALFGASLVLLCQDVGQLRDAPESIAQADADHGLCAFLGRDPAGGDTLLVLRRPTAFSAQEREWFSLLATHVGTALELARRSRAATPEPAAAMIVSSCAPLTKAELEVLGSLLRGQTAKEIARARGASLNTVRSQITSILGKTGRHTQKELIAAFGNV